ncbi:MAG: YkgJ family cysteine cluster protein [Syntrophobacteraceae bacterium]|jgi:Fe-S-cluster containining protein|nr:YkgJ family cysteine cluster protein [Syntrophobacteraceae bacterium]
MKEERESALDIEDLYAMLPEVDCIPGCTECCREFGIPCRTPVEDERFKAYLKENGRELGQAVGTTCPYVTEVGCGVYSVRPFTCRLYGASVSYRCRWGAAPIRLLNEDEEEEILHLYRSNFF